MTTHADSIKAVLAADIGVGGVATLLTGGIYVFTGIGRLGLSPNYAAVAAAFDANGIIKPCVVVKMRSETPMSDLSDQGTQQTATRSVVELIFVDDGDNAYGTIDTAKLRAWTLLHNKQISGAFLVQWMIDLPRIREQELNDASVCRSDYTVIGQRT